MKSSIRRYVTGVLITAAATASVAVAGSGTASAYYPPFKPYSTKQECETTKNFYQPPPNSTYYCEGWKYNPSYPDIASGWYIQRAWQV